MVVVVVVVVVAAAVAAAAQSPIGCAIANMNPQARQRSVKDSSAAPCDSGTQIWAGVGPSRPRGYRASQAARRPGTDPAAVAAAAVPWRLRRTWLSLGEKSTEHWKFSNT